MDNVNANNLGDLPFKPVTSGANLRIVSPYDEGVYYGTRTLGGQTVASAIQCYLDLKNEKARGEEAAAALLEQVINRHRDEGHGHARSPETERSI